MQTDPVLVIAILLGAALVGGIVAHRLKQPVILGYLIAGAVVGPNSVGLVADVELVKALASIGVTLLIFTLGMEVSISQIRDVGRVGLWGSVAQVLITFFVGVAAGLYLFEWSLPQSALFGLIISMSSTAVCLKILIDRGEVSSVHGRIMLAMLILQDVSMVVMMVILPLIEGVATNFPLTVARSAGLSILFVGIAIVAGRWVIPWLLGRVGSTRARELFLLTILAICLAAAIGTEIAGLSVVFGAFLIGVVLRETTFMHQILAEVIPFRDIFAAMFFVSLGMLFDPFFLTSHWSQVAQAVAIIIIIKVIVVYSVVRVFGFSNRIAILTGAGLFQIGELGFILAQGGTELGFVSSDFDALITSSAIITMLLTPISIGTVSWLYPRLASWRFGEATPGPKKGAEAATAVKSDSGAQAGARPVIIAGYGRVGEAIARGLEEAEVPFEVVELDPQRIAEARTMDYPCVYGDCSNVSVLTHLDLENARALVITYPDPIAVETTVKMARRINPDLPILARVHRQKDAERLVKLGVVELISPESEASSRFVNRILHIEGKHKEEERRILAEFHGE